MSDQPQKPQIRRMQLKPLDPEPAAKEANAPSPDLPGAPEPVSAPVSESLPSVPTDSISSPPPEPAPAPEPPPASDASADTGSKLKLKLRGAAVSTPTPAAPPPVASPAEPASMLKLGDRLTASSPPPAVPAASSPTASPVSPPPLPKPAVPAPFVPPPSAKPAGGEVPLVVAKAKGMPPIHIKTDRNIEIQPAPPPAVPRKAHGKLRGLLIAIVILAACVAFYTYKKMVAPPPPLPPRLTKKAPPPPVAAPAPPAPAPVPVPAPQTQPQPPTSTENEVPRIEIREGVPNDKRIDHVIAGQQASLNEILAADPSTQPAPKPAPEPAVVAKPLPAPPPPGPTVAVRAWVAEVRIGGVRYGESPRVFIDGATYKPGDMVKPDLSICLERVDAQRKVLLFRDRFGNILERRL